MRIKLKYSKVFFAIIMFIIICDCNFFRLFKFDDYIYKAISLLISGLIILVCVMRMDIWKMCISNGKYLIAYMGIVIIFLLFEYIYTKRVYEDLQSFYEFAKYNKHYIYTFLAIPLLYIFIVQDNFQKTMDTILFLVTITLGLILFHTLLYNWQGIGFLNIGVYVSRHTRSGRMRVWDLSSLEGMAIIYGFCHFWSIRKKRVLYLLEVFICIVALIYVEQTRMMLIALAVSLLFAILIKSGKTISQIFTKSIVLIFACISGSLFVIPKLIASFSKGVSISYRLVEIQFVVAYLKNKGIFGMGMIGTNIQRHLFYHGIFSNISLDDIGIIGYTAQAGIWSVGLYFLPMCRMGWILLHGEKNNFKIFLWSIYCYLVITSATLLILDSQRILMWPFCLALFEYYNMKYGKRRIGNSPIKD